jgi:valyl-tRNA synthetase
MSSAPPKKDLASGYQPKVVERDWYSWWQTEGLFHADNSPENDAETFVMMIPPPNVTGHLHIGHALTNAVQDALTRWHMMLGHNSLWLPGTDHAGIATQVVVEKQLMHQTGQTRYDIGREAFVDRAWAWKEEKGGHIFQQLRLLGAAFDWERECFTMDEARSVAVTEAFCRLFEKGLVYRSNRLVNWDCHLQTAISDIEVDHVEIDTPTEFRIPTHDKPVSLGWMTHFLYPLEPVEGLIPEGSTIEIATTRLETMLADAAVAVNPKDPRYTHLHGQFVRHPFSNKLIPIILDEELVDMEFGTGAVKITPAHDPNDYASAQRHGLPLVNLLTTEGKINENGGEFAGLSRYAAREAVEAALKAKGLFVEKKPHKMAIGFCQRSHDPVEPMLKPQWYVDCKDMAARAVAAVRDGDLRITPSFHEKTWFRWLENIRDWCVSRQLWWGHRIPAYRVSAPGVVELSEEKWVVERSEEAARRKAAAELGVAPEQVVLEQDPDVLDTWFSSGLFPFATIGWPNEDSLDFQKFFPNSVLETGHDILFFWVARMVMMSLTLVDQLPFKDVYLHAMVRDAHGRKMSKSLGNVIDPIDVINGISLADLHAQIDASTNLPAHEVAKAKAGQTADFPEGIEECGADALRFALCAYMGQGRDINLDVKRVVGYRNFCNKLWNATKFALSVASISEGYVPPATLAATTDLELSLVDRWVLSRAAAAVNAANAGLASYDLAASTTACYAFWLYDLCDTYIEAVKPVFRSGTEAQQAAARATMFACLDTGLRLIHPFMPFVSEELWQHLPRRTSETAAHPSIMRAAFPTTEVYGTFRSEQLEADFANVQAIAGAIRQVRAQYSLPNSKQPTVYICSESAEEHAAVAAAASTIGALSTSAVTVVENREAFSSGCAASVLNGTCHIGVLLAGMIDVAQELARLDKQAALYERQIKGFQAKLGNERFMAKAKAAVVEDFKEKLATAEAQLAALTVTREQFAALA